MGLCDQKVFALYLGLFRGVPIKYYKNVIELMFARSLNLEGPRTKYQALLYENTKRNGNKV